MERKLTCIPTEQLIQYKEIVTLLGNFGYGGELTDVIQSLKSAMEAHKVDVPTTFNYEIDRNDV